MWLLTPLGFVSIVAHRERPDTVLVRARTRADAQAFADAILDAHAMTVVNPHTAHEDVCSPIRHTPRADYAFRFEVCSPIRHTPRADYAFRFEVKKRHLAAALSTFVLRDLDYANFKDEVARVQGRERAHLYHDVWSVLHTLQEGGHRATAPVVRERSARASDRARRARPHEG